MTGTRLITAAAILTATGTFLLYAGLHGADSGLPAAVPARTPKPASSPPLSPAPSSASPSASLTPRPEAATAAAPSAHPQTPSGSQPASGPASHPQQLPPPGSGPAADPIIQRALDQASGTDLPPADEQLLLGLGRTAWLAETAGYSQVRIQAATARRDGDPSRAVVRLVWEGADRAGTFLDGRPATVHFTQNGNGSWNRTA
ncbi:hypothetical protein [Streptomyces lavendulae]|uniref:hypothetical protein n=1 Tax=Streptomyces lavendulae TaxID=1914 RepID=UPI0033E64B42